MKTSKIISILIFLIAAYSLFAGSPHPVYIEVYDASMYHPTTANFTAWVVGRETDQLTETSGGCGYLADEGLLFIQCGTFTNDWTAGETLHVEVNSSLGDGSGEFLLTNAGGDFFGPTNFSSPGIQVQIVDTLIADFIASETLILEGETIQFTDTSTGHPISWQWDFNDDGYPDAQSQNPTWSYDFPGTYTVSLTVTDSIPNTDTMTKVDYIDVRVNIPDVNFKTAINNELGQPVDHDPTLTEMESITILDASNYNIYSIEGAGYLSFLSELDLNGNFLDEIYELSDLYDLYWLDIAHNNIDDLYPLQNISLDYLDVSYNPVNLYSIPITLQELIAMGLGLTSLDGIENFDNLILLDLSENSISNLNPLANLTTLNELLLEQNQISDLSPISTLPNLTYLDADNNLINDISIITDMFTITTLYLSNNQINNISSLSGLTNLRHLALAGNQITDISSLEGLTNLDVLMLANNQIQDISPLANIVNIDYLYLSNNLISDISVLSNLTNMYELTLHGNNITDIYPLVENTSFGYTDNLYLEHINDSNPLSKEAITEHIPILESRDFATLAYPINAYLEAPCYPYPERYADLVSPSVELQWQGNFSRNAVYDVFLGTDPDSLQNIGNGSLVSDSLYGISPMLTSYTTYFWKVRGITATDTLWSGLWQFETDDDVNDPPELIQPLGNIKLYVNMPDSNSINLFTNFSDPEGDTLQFSYAGNNHIAVEILSDGDVILTPEQDWTGFETIAFLADDGMGKGVTSDTLSVNVVPMDGTIIEGGEITGMWDLENAPYHVMADIHIPSGSSLTIQSYEDEMIDVIFYNNASLSVNGQIQAEFANFTGYNNDVWAGISLYESEFQSSFINCEIHNAFFPFSIYNSSPVMNFVWITNSTRTVSGNAIMVEGQSNIDLNYVEIYNYSGTAIELNNPNRNRSLPTLSNIRVQNSSSSTRENSIGIDIRGNVSAQLDEVLLENTNIGINYIGAGERYRDLPTLSNIRVQNSSSSTRANSIGINVKNVPDIIAENDSIANCEIGISIVDSTRSRSLPTLSNIRVQNSSSSTRANQIGILLQGDISAQMNDVLLENVSCGIDYTGNGMRYRDLPTLSNIRVQNSSSSTRTSSTGIKLENVSDFVAENDTISECSTGFTASNTTDQSSLPTLSNIRVQNSSSSSRNSQKGIELIGTFSDVSIMKNMIANCDSSFILKGQITANFTENTAYDSGDRRINSTGLYILGGDVSCMNNTFYRFTHAISANLSTLNMQKNILWDDNPNADIVNSPNASITSGNNTIFLPGGATFSPDDINVDPRFIGSEGDNIDLHLQNGPVLANGIGSLGFPDDEIHPTEPLASEWNLVGIPVSLQWGYNSPLVVLGDDISPFNLLPYYSHIYAFDSDQFDYVVPDTLAIGIGYWLNANSGAMIDADGYISEESLEVGIQGDANASDGWHLIANPFDLPVLFDDLEFDGDVMAGGYIYDSENNGYVMVQSGDDIPAWSGIFMKGNTADASIVFHYPSLAKRNPESRPDIESWFVQLQAEVDNSQTEFFAGASEISSDGYDSNDMMSLPPLPFLPDMNMINLESVHMDWQNQAGYYRKDMRELNHEIYVYELELRTVGTTTISLQNFENVPAEYDVMLTNQLTEERINLRESDLIIEVSNSNKIEKDRDIEIFQLILEIGVNLSDDEGQVPIYQFGLGSNYPNPFNPTTTIIYSLAEDCNATLEIYNVKGQKVCTLANGMQESGYHQVIWNGTDENNRSVSSGLYFYRLHNEDKTITKKMLMVK